MPKVYLISSNEQLDEPEHIRDITVNLFVQSAKYISKTIHNSSSQEQFLKTCKRIQEILYYEFKGEDPFRRSYSRLVLLERGIKYSREIDHSFLDFINPKEKYDKLAFNIVFDILNKIEVRFFKGCYGQN